MWKSLEIFCTDVWQQEASVQWDPQGSWGRDVGSRSYVPLRFNLGVLVYFLIFLKRFLRCLTLEGLGAAPVYCLLPIPSRFPFTSITLSMPAIFIEGPYMTLLVARQYFNVFHIAAG